MAKNQKSNSGNDFNSTELGGNAEPQTDTRFTNESAEKETAATPEKPKRKKEVVVSGAEYWRFAPETDGGEFDGPEFIGRYCGDVKREKDGAKAATDPSHKAGATIGYDFEQEGTGLHFLVSKSHAIEKALQKKNFDKTLLWCIEFLGKGETSSNQPYNRFEVSVLSED